MSGRTRPSRCGRSTARRWSTAGRNTISAPCPTASRCPPTRRRLPAAARRSSPIMGQAPGTHWYHAHKHGSTAINVANGMVGAFIIEGQYDDEINATYSKYMLSGRQAVEYARPAGAGAQPARHDAPICCPRRRSGEAGRHRPHRERPPAADHRDAARRGPALAHRQRVGAQRRLLHGARGLSRGGRSRRTACSSPTRTTRAGSENRPFYLAPGNRVDLLVQAPMVEIKADVLIQAVMARSRSSRRRPARPRPIPSRACR